MIIVKLFNPFSLGYLHCNEYDSLRLRWLRQTLESFIPQPLVNVIKVSELDGREMGDAQPETFDKVLLYIVTNWWTPSDTTVKLLCCSCFPSASRHSLIQFLSTLGNFDKMNSEAVFIWWSACSKEALTLGLGIIECFLFPGTSKILRNKIRYYLGQ